jgi:hypothetical protein
MSVHKVDLLLYMAFVCFVYSTVQLYVVYETLNG